MYIVGKHLCIMFKGKVHSNTPKLKIISLQNLIRPAVKISTGEKKFVHWGVLGYTAMPSVVMWKGHSTSVILVI